MQSDVSFEFAFDLDYSFQESPQTFCMSCFVHKLQKILNLRFCCSIFIFSHINFPIIGWADNFFSFSIIGCDIYVRMLNGLLDSQTKGLVGIWPVHMNLELKIIILMSCSPHFITKCKTLFYKQGRNWFDSFQEVILNPAVCSKNSDRRNEMTLEFLLNSSRILTEELKWLWN